MRIFCLVGTCVFVIFSLSCAPKIYVVDRQTVMEQESAGEWPQFEQELTGGAVAQGPTSFAKVPITEKKARLFKVLNGELIAQPEPQKPVEKK